MTKLVWAILLTLCVGTADTQTIRRRPPTYYGGGTATLTIDDSSSGTSAASSTVSASHVFTTNSNRYAIIFVGVSSNSYRPDSIDVGGPNATLDTLLTSGDWQTLSCWKIDDPPTGAQTVTAYLNGSPVDAVIGIFSFYSASGVGTHAATWAASSASSSVNVSSATGEYVVDAAYVYNGTSTMSAGAGQTVYITRDGGDGNGGMKGSIESGSATTTMSWSWTGSCENFLIAIPVKP